MKEGFLKASINYAYLLSAELSDWEDVSELDVIVLCTDLSEESWPSPQAKTSEVEKRTISDIVSKINFFIIIPSLYFL